MRLTDYHDGAQWACGYSASSPFTASGTLVVGSVPAGQSIGEWTSLPSFMCSGPLGIVHTVTVGKLPWHLDATAYDAASDTTTGMLTGLSFHWVGLGSTVDFDGPGGAGSGTGSLPFSYDNAAHLLTLNGGGALEAYNVTGTDLGLLDDGDPVGLDATMPVTPAQTIRPDGVTG
ncbi:hypothetical protein [Streptomyces sp. NPDC087270]|uniref:hypothetical protein n=1 Tax=Streptomyces sp. NPDC087270 TaxID=3365774 RepID=UPI00381B285F